MSEYREKIVREYPYLDQNTGEEVVRCRDCKGKDYCEAYQDYKNPDGFCAWGERREA